MTDDDDRETLQLSDSENDHRNWLSFVLVGCLLAALGVAAVLAPAVSTIAITTVLGSLLAVGGAVCVVQALMVKEWSGFNWQLLLGATEVVGGIFIMASPFKGAAAVTLIVAIIVGGLGVTQAGLAFRVRPAAGWGWLLLASLASILIAAALLLRFPFSITESPGVMAGVSLIFGGLAYAMVGFGRRKRLSSEAS